ncbi:MAG TPA: ribosome small subunit-dependent GTPase A [Chryseolinea sp.]|nr:ribosome small subunit-dependent GTPase A [Chryseolinea sp.]
MTGIVMRSTGSFYDVLTDDGRRYNCRVRGKIRLDGIKETNPVAVGDVVRIDVEQDIGSILEILPRKNHMLRQSVKKTGHAHVLASNIDQVVLIVTLAFPRTSLGFIDRALISAEAFGIPQVLVFNKRDLLDAREIEICESLMSVYENIGVKCKLISALDPDQQVVKEIIKDKTSLVTGHSGVGKSTLLNKISPVIRQSTGSVSGFSEKGTHTTTFAEMFQLDPKTFVIDTPGIKEWGLVDMSPAEVSDYFPEIRAIRGQCKFQSRCLHINEPKCAVRDAVENGLIAASRYESYVSILEGNDNRR